VFVAMFVRRLDLEAISKKSFRPISALSPRLKSSTYLSMRVEDPVNKRGGLIFGLALISAENPNFEITSVKSKTK
jgi:hypothetical protein